MQTTFGQMQRGAKTLGTCEAERRSLTKTYLYREGNGNEGNFPRCLIEITDEQDPYAALAAIVVSQFTLSARPFIIDNLDIDGEADYGIMATIYEGPDGETDFGAAWFTAELEPYNGDDGRHPIHTLAEYLGADADALAYYEKESNK